MLTLLSRLFIPDYENYSSPKVRQAYGILTGSVGIFFNFFLIARIPDFSRSLRL